VEVVAAAAAAAAKTVDSRQKWPAPVYAQLPPGSVPWEECSNPGP
jgi:hypothetical protein